MTVRKSTTLKSTKQSDPIHGAFQLVFSQSPIPMWTYDPESLKIIEVNDALINLTGYERSDFMDLITSDLFSTNESSLLAADLKKNSENSLSLGRRHLRRKSGALISVELTTQLFESNEKRSSILLVAKQTAIADQAITLHEKNQLRHAVLENLRGVIIFSLDMHYQYIAFTASHKEVMKTIWGVNIEIGMNMLECINRQDDRTKAQANFDRALQGEYITVEEEYGGGDEHQRLWWENRYSPVYDLDNHIIGLTVFVIDVTQRKQVETALHDSEKNYHSIMDQASDGIFIADPKGKYLDVNQAGCEMLGYTRDEILQLSISSLTVMKENTLLRFDELLAGKILISEREMIRKDGSKIAVEISAKMLGDGRLQGIVRNITSRKVEEGRLRHQAFVLSNMSSAIISTDREMRITQWNKAAEDLYGWKESEVIGLYINDVCRTEYNDSQQEEAKMSFQVDRRWHGEVKQYHRDGRELWVSVYVTLLDDEHGNFISGVTINHDITERREAEDDLRRAKDAIEEINESLQRAFEHEQIASRTDNLTGVYNRRYFFEFMEYQFSMSKRYNLPASVILFDIDNFKQINDTYGHLAGDEVLISVSRIVRQELRESDVLARFGGDEFIILISNNSMEAVRNLIERIREKLNSLTIEVNGLKIKVTISAGVADIQPDVDNSTKLVNRADQALYIAKQSGRNRVAFAPVEKS